MSDLNNLSMTGRLVRDPELRHTAKGLAVASFTVACNGFKDDDVCFLRCSAFGKRGESLAQHMTKGRSIGVTGRLTLNRWQDKEGNKREQHELQVNDWNFVGPPDKQGSDRPPKQSGDDNYDWGMTTDGTPDDGAGAPF